MKPLAPKVFQHRLFNSFFMIFSQFSSVYYGIFGGGKYLLYIPTKFFSALKYSSPKPQLFSPLRNGFNFSFVGNQVVVGTVHLLFLLSTPLAIFLAIVSFGVNSVYGSIFLSVLFGMCLVTFMHVLKKSVKNEPFFTNSNTPSPVVFKSPMFWIKTSLLHRAPNIIESCP